MSKKELASEKEPILETKTQPMDTGVSSFKVGGVLRELKFSAATRYRLFLDIPQESIQNYIASDLFKITATALLLYGKEAVGKSIQDTLELFEADKLMDDEMEAIVAWVRKRTLNFMLTEAEEIAKAMAEVIPKATQLNNTLIGSQDYVMKK